MCSLLIRRAPSRESMCTFAYFRFHPHSSWLVRELSPIALDAEVEAVGAGAGGFCRTLEILIGESIAHCWLGEKFVPQVPWCGATKKL